MAGNPVEISSVGKGKTTLTASGRPANIPDDDKIPLTRHVARVQLQAIDCEPSDSSSVPTGAAHKDAGTTDGHIQDRNRF